MLPERLARRDLGGAVGAVDGLARAISRVGLAPSPLEAGSLCSPGPARGKYGGVGACLPRPAGPALGGRCRRRGCRDVRHRSVSQIRVARRGVARGKRIALVLTGRTVLQHEIEHKLAQDLDRHRGNENLQRRRGGGLAHRNPEVGGDSMTPSASAGKGRLFVRAPRGGFGEPDGPKAHVGPCRRQGGEGSGESMTPPARGSKLSRWLADRRSVLRVGRPAAGNSAFIFEFSMMHRR
jgi:hypothetical protein